MIAIFVYRIQDPEGEELKWFKAQNDRKLKNTSSPPTLRSNG
ncbi:hypothetical protein [Chamaesiphon minutus]|nr:hypothetical protein [Chamaesiphon minutus]